MCFFFFFSRDRIDIRVKGKMFQAKYRILLKEALVEGEMDFSVAVHLSAGH